MTIQKTMTKRELKQWLDAMPEAERLEVAKLNPSASWAQPILAAAPPEPPPTLTESAEVLAKRAAAGYYEALDRLETHVAKHVVKGADPHATMGALIEARDEKTLALVADVRTAQDLALSTPVDGVLKAHDGTIETLASRLEAECEAFSKAHNVGQDAAHERLLKIAPSYARTYEELLDAHRARQEAAIETAGRATVALQGELHKRYEAAVGEQNAADAADAAEAFKQMTPSEVALHKMAEDYARIAKVDVTVGYGIAMEKSAEARDLYRKAQAERAVRA